MVVRDPGELLCNIIVNPVISRDPRYYIDSIIFNDPELTGCITIESALLFETIVESTMHQEN